MPFDKDGNATIPPPTDDPGPGAPRDSIPIWELVFLWGSLVYVVLMGLSSLIIIFLISMGVLG